MIELIRYGECQLGGDAVGVKHATPSGEEETVKRRGKVFDKL